MSDHTTPVPLVEYQHPRLGKVLVNQAMADQFDREQAAAAPTAPPAVVGHIEPDPNQGQEPTASESETEDPKVEDPPKVDPPKSPSRTRNAR